MKVKKLIDWLSTDFHSDDDIFALIWGKESFSHYDHDTDTEMPLSDSAWAEAVEASEDDRFVEQVCSQIHEMITEHIQRPEPEVAA